jgi:hypothetical protein
MSAAVRTKKIEELRDLHKPTTFDAWVCLGGDYRDQAEVQEWATQEEAQELSSAYTAFREKLEYNAMLEKADAVQARQWFRSESEPEPEPEPECYWCEDTEGVTLVKSYQLYGCRECAVECGSD